MFGAAATYLVITPDCPASPLASATTNRSGSGGSGTDISASRD
jgi:hypothetical protein